MMTGAEFLAPPPAPTASGIVFPGPNTPVQGGDQAGRGHNPDSPTLPMASGFPGQTLHAGPSLCTGCSQPILDEFVLQVEGHTWHAGCLRCQVCHARLSHVCYSGNSQLLCQDDFFRIFGATCSVCREVIAPSAVVRRAHDRVYHQDCFRCSVCRRELCTGDQFYLGQGGQLCCKEDFIQRGEEGPSSTEEIPNFKDARLASAKSIPVNPESISLEERERMLDQRFLENQKPPSSEIEAMAAMLRMEPASLRQWFRKRRAQSKRKGNNSGIINGGRRNNRVTAPTGGYPLPIVNKALSVECPPETASTFNHNINSSHPQNRPALYLTDWEELCSDEFVPPNVELQPEQFKDGEIVLFPLQDQPKGQGYTEVQEQCQGQEGESLYQTSNHHHCPHHNQHQQPLYNNSLSFTTNTGGCNVPPHGTVNATKSTSDQPKPLNEYHHHQEEQEQEQQLHHYTAAQQHAIRGSILNQGEDFLPKPSNTTSLDTDAPSSSLGSATTTTTACSVPSGSNQSLDGTVEPAASSNSNGNINDSCNNFPSLLISGSLCNVPNHLFQQQQQQQQHYMPFMHTTNTKAVLTALN